MFIEKLNQRIYKKKLTCKKLNSTYTIIYYRKMVKLIPLAPTVREALLFQTGAPELVVQKGELKALDGRCCNQANIINTRTTSRKNRTPIAVGKKSDSLNKK